ncbi:MULTISPECIES: hypothetical protein [unclassified Janthinobacterium]|uniref:hypothetical protein n=1 Tax=unclassified Janthinobacterium TaxID=2610881 RepID=UPI002472F144|nr:hypothetical protein [Janthinobacterium sp. CG_23.4]MDH6157917.1 hypothetical protein [Janthinobacterium sp. CG_23.4]
MAIPFKKRDGGKQRQSGVRFYRTAPRRVAGAAAGACAAQNDSENAMLHCNIEMR